MLVYQSTVKEFNKDVLNGLIANKIEQCFSSVGIRKESLQEYQSWKNSLPRMAVVLNESDISKDAEVAIEFQIPLTSKRVDFMVAGNDGNQDHVVVIELKQWDKCFATSRENVVNAFVAGANRDLAHPSQQAYSYAKLIENFNETVELEDIHLEPCAYCHNYEEKYRNEICNKHYDEIIKLAPVYLEQDGGKLSEFISKYIKQPSNKRLFELIDNGKLKPSKSLQTAVGSILNGNKEFELVDEQLVAYSTILKLVENTLKDNKKHTVIIQGGPGTGKSVIAINLLAKLLNNKFSCLYVTKTSAPRRVFSDSLVKGKYTLSYLKGLFRSSGTLYKANKDAFDCLLVDEAHRLNDKSGLYHNEGENQIKEIINASKISVFFIDEDQRVSVTDIGSIDEIKKWANYYDSQIHYNDSLILKSQFRCNGSDGYLAFLDNLLEIRETANHKFDIDYDIKIFDDPNVMKEKLREKNKNNKARLIAGYCYDWISKNDKTKYDIKLENGFEAQWNFTTDSFAIDANSFEQVGCIHSTQGLEFEYVGIIIGNDLRYENGHVITDVVSRSKDDKTVFGLRGPKGNKELADRIIRNTYKTLLSRGLKGCYVYCQDKALADYIRKCLER